MLTDKFIQAGQWQAEAVEILQRIKIMEILLVFIYLIKINIHILNAWIIARIKGTGGSRAKI